MHSDDAATPLPKFVLIEGDEAPEEADSESEGQVRARRGMTRPNKGRTRGRARTLQMAISSTRLVKRASLRALPIAACPAS